jgi:6-pyruvoyltetrahydropterin/6-carboxytetrahydropterin synthase
MVELARTVRFAVNEAREWGPPSNTFAGYPSVQGLGRYYELDVRCRGDVDARTGYFLNIKEVDQAARQAMVPVIERACRERPGAEPAAVLLEGAAALGKALGGRLFSVRWRLSPYYSVEVETGLGTSGKALLRQQFEFAASHRLHVSTMTDEENRRVFGRCNSATGHGHNYRVEPCVEVEVGVGNTGETPGPVTGNALRRTTFGLADLERIVQEQVINRFDHKHLNEDTPEFATGRGLNPSVENIAKVCFELLEPAISGAGGPAGGNGRIRLRSVTVWETDKTSCTYPA